MSQRWKALKESYRQGWEAVRRELRKKENLTLIVAVLLAVVVILGVTVAFMIKPAKYDDQDLEPQVNVQTSDVIRHPLTGVVLDEPLEELPQVFGVMVENSADAWPLSGLEDAYLVIEAPVEGMIPRFISFFADDMEVAQIGPVRSARPYYIDWNDELGGVYAHVGGSPEGLDLIKQYGTTDLNEFYQGEYFWRDTTYRAAPHNAYTSTERLIDALDELKLDEPSYQSWSFKTDSPLDVDPLSITIDWEQGTLYDVTWSYQPGSNSYLRKQGTDVVESRDGDQILANNVIVMAAEITVVDSTGRRHIKTVSEGDALIVQDGRMILGRWKKAERTERLRFYNAEGKEIEMNAGKTWIEVVSSLDKVSSVHESL